MHSTVPPTRGRASPSPRELTAAAIFLTVVAGAFFWSHIRHGGLYLDDWESVSLARFDTHGLFHILLPSWTNPGNRPLHNLDYSIILAILGNHQHAFPAYTALCTAAVSLVVYALLRVLDVGRVYALIIALLIMVYPFADSTHLWFSSTDSDVTIVLYVLGVIVAIRGLHQSGRSAIAHHIVAVALFACSIMIYESTASLIMLTGLLYWRLAGRRAAIRRWAVDIGCAVLLLLLFTRNSALPRTDGISALTLHAQLIYEQSLTILARTVVPLNIDQTPVLIGTLVTLIGGALLYWRLPRDDRLSSPLGHWLLFVLSALIITISAFAMFIPAASYYVPFAAGVGNRVDAVPAIGLVFAAFGVYMVLGMLVGWTLHAIRAMVTRVPNNSGVLAANIAVTVGISLTLLTGVRWAHLQHEDAAAWNLASSYQLRALDRIRQLVPHPNRYESLLVFGGPAYTRPGVPVFAATWDLQGAVETYYNDFTLTAIPIISGVNLSCMTKGITSSLGTGPTGGFPYGQTTLVDIQSGRVMRPENHKQCAVALPMLQPGPLTLLAPPLA